MHNKKEYRNNITLIHEQTREYAYPAERNELIIKFVCSRSIKIKCKLTYWNRFKQDSNTSDEIEMKCFARDDRFDYFKCRIVDNEAIKYLRYFFTIEYNGEICYLSAHGKTKEKPKEGFFEYLCTNENDIFRVPKWMENTIFYQIFPERFYKDDTVNSIKKLVKWNGKPTRENFFGGNIRGIINKLDYLSELQINAIYLNPLFLAPSNHKYDTVDYFNIDPSFGSMDDFKKLVKECHNRNIKVIIDGVFNHCGYYFKQFQDVLKNGEKSKYKDWFYIKEFPVETEPPNYECVGYYKWMPKLRFSNQEVRDFFLKVGAFWLEATYVDGWRLDVCDEVDFTFWQQFRRKIKTINKNAVLIGETWGDGRNLLGGDQMDSVMNYLFRDAIVDFIAKDNIDARAFDYRLQRMYAIYSEMVYPGLYNLIGSHDTSRFLTLCNGDISKLKLAVVLQMTFLGMPAIYYGDEIGMQGENDPDCRKPMNWVEKNEKILKFYKRIIDIRKSRSSLIKGELISVVADKGVYAYLRRSEEEVTYIVVNNSKNTVSVKLPLLDDVCLGTTYQSLIDEKIYHPRKIEDENGFYNSDINNYKNYIEITISDYNFDIVK